MKIAHYIPTRYPFSGYGGKERKAYWMGKALAEMGHEVTFLCDEGSRLPFANCIDVPRKITSLDPYIPSGVDIVQFYATPDFEFHSPYLVHIGGNGKAGEKFLPNTVFGSRNHAERHNWTEFVMNGLDLNEYPFQPKKQNYLAFLARAKWKVKNLKGAIRIAQDSKRKLIVGGGRAPFWKRGVSSLGTVDGERKLNLLGNAYAFLFPIIWEEPFGNVVIEALACGTPVLTTPRGAMPELITPECGFLCQSHSEFIESIELASKLSPEACRARVESQFTHYRMAEDALGYYKKVLSEGKLREGNPFCDLSSDPVQITLYEGYQT